MTHTQPPGTLAMHRQPAVPATCPGGVPELVVWPLTPRKEGMAHGAIQLAPGWPPGDCRGGSHGAGHSGAVSGSVAG